MNLPRARRFPAQIPLCSTADIAFLLLIFFIVLAKGAQESAIEWRPAVTPAHLMDAGDAVCSIAIDRHSTVFLDGQPVPSPNLKDAVAGRLGGRSPGHRKILLKIDRDVPARVFQQVMLDIADAGGEMFRVLEEAKKR